MIASEEVLQSNPKTVLVSIETCGGHLDWSAPHNVACVSSFQGRSFPSLYFQIYLPQDTLLEAAHPQIWQS